MQKKLEKLKELTDLFRLNISQYKKSSYDEANTRADFIDKFFEILDWDVRNEKGFSEDFREVVREDKVVIEGKPKAPDYSFNIGRRERMFFVEAKKPSINIKEDIAPAYQIRRYGYTAKLPLSILTDFEEFAVYDTRIKPNQNDKSSVARVFYCTFEEYEKHFEFIYNTFSITSIRKGSFDKYVKENKNKRGTTEVDNEFLKLIEGWRSELARNIALRNKELNIYDLNYAIQKIVDRIIFMRIAEDRNMENYGNLQKTLKSENIYQVLSKIFNKANDKYNSGLFKIEKWLNELEIDNKIIKNIINGIYYPKCPYELSIMPIETLGNIYEQFLGKIIRLTPSHQAKVEEKPEVKKAGGVYYTPQYIVNYIVKNTVGEKIKNKSPNEISQLKILDPACGSGSFLVGAYQYLLDYHTQYYSDEKRIKTALKQGKIYQISIKTYRLSIEQKQSILLNNLFGVDIDTQAVEVTKLSLLLKLLENEHIESTGLLFKHSDLKLLPDLSDNIKCGNSLIGSDFYENKELSLFDDENIKKINAFDWEKEFPGTINNGGFDCVIGNPPYVKEHTDKSAFQFKDGKLKKYYKGKMDLWYAFACFAIDLLKDNGLHSFIATNNWITNYGALILRNKIINETRIFKYADFADYKVFKNASIQTMIYVVKKEKPPKLYKIKYTKLLNKNITIDDLKDTLNTDIWKFKNINKSDYERFNAVIKPKCLENDGITFVNEDVQNVLSKIRLKSNYCLSKENVGNAIDVLQDFVIKKHLKILDDNSINKGDGIFVLSKEEIDKIKFSFKEKNVLKPYYSTKELKKYFANCNNTYWLIYSDKNVRNNINDYPNLKKHLEKFKNIMTSAFKPYGLHRAREERFFKGEKILSQRKTREPSFTYTDFPCYVTRAFLIIKTGSINLKYLTAILNSKLIHFWLFYKGKKQGDQLQIDKAPLLNLPLIKTTSIKNKDKIVSLVDQIMGSQKQFHTAKSENSKKIYKQKIDILDKQIDNIVYQLYDLTKDEIEIIEKSV